MDGLLDSATALVQWAWARHHNILSWYVRPLLLIPMGYFAWKRSLTGIVVSFLALLSSMAWFPAPQSPDPRVEALLAAEKAYLLGPWPWWKFLITFAGAASLITMCVAFWMRSWKLGLVVVTANMVAKIAWTYVFTGADAAGKLVLPALVGTFAVNAAIVLAVRYAKTLDKQP